MANPIPTPRFLSLDFHTRFFPSVLWRRLRTRSESTGSPFANHVPLELPIVLVVCLALVLGGLPSAVEHGSVIGWIACSLGLVGAIALIVQSIQAQVGARPTFEAFRLGAFVFFLALGLTLGLVLGSVLHSRALEWLAAVGGLAAGYLVGIAAGLGVQYLGWIGAWVELAAALAALGMVVVDLVLVFG